jgi:hypothetical protein
MEIDYLKQLQADMQGETELPEEREEYVTAPKLKTEDVLDVDKMQSDISSLSDSSIKAAQEAELQDPSGYEEYLPEQPDLPKQPELSPQEKLIKELRSIQENKRALLANAIKALGTIGQAQIQRSAGIPIGLKAAEMTAARDVSSPILKERDSMLKQMMDEYKLLQNKDDLTTYQRKSLDLQQKRIDALKDKEERLTKKDAFQEEVKNRLSDKEVEGINAFDDGTRILDDIDDLLRDGDVQSDLGPYASRLEEVQKYVPFMERDEDFVKTQQLVGIQLADYVKSISGAQVSEQEAARLLKNIPNMTDKPKAFKTKLDQFKKELEGARETYLKNIEKQKKGAKKYLDSTGKAKDDSPYGQEIEKNGKMYKWNPIVKKYQLI